MNSVSAQTSDEDLMRLFQAAGNVVSVRVETRAAAFEELVDRYSRSLLAYIQRLTGAGEEAEDLLQEVFVRVFRAADQFDAERRIQSWIYAIASNLCRDHLRAGKRRAQPMDLGLEADAGPRRFDWIFSSRAKNPADHAAEVELIQELHASIEELPFAQRQIFLMFHFQKISQVEIAGILQVPIGTVKSRLFHAYNKVFSSMDFNRTPSRTIASRLRWPRLIRRPD